MMGFKKVGLRLGLLVAVWCSGANAEVSGNGSAQVSGHVLGNEWNGRRLSEFLLEQASAPGGAAAYWEATVWQLPAEIPAQSRLKNALLNDVYVDIGERNRIYRFLSALPVTGRVNLKSTDARLLQARPALDPVLAAGQTVSVPAMPPVPAPVALMDETGVPCRARFEAGREVLDYVLACYPYTSAGHATAYLVQPDGQVFDIPLGAWAGGKQALPAPGAWVWVAEDEGAWFSKSLPQGFGRRMADFLATQGSSYTAQANAALGAVKPVNLAPAGFEMRRPFLSRSRDLVVSGSDFGTVGLLQTPTARMRKAGAFNYTHTFLPEYRYYNVTLQPYDWLEAGIRYTAIQNRAYCEGCEQTYKDKSFDFKARLFNETALTPALAVGIKDVGGTGLFAGEYLVANKRLGDFDVSLGLGWGYFGLRGNRSNPLGVISDKFDTRPSPDVGKGGTVSASTFFRGPTALFGGVQYQTPWDPLTLKLEFDGNDYQKEPLGNKFVQDSRLNYGLVYRLSDAFDLRFGRERGNVTMFGVSISADLLGPETQKILDDPKLRVTKKQGSEPVVWADTANTLGQSLNWPVKSVQREGSELILTLRDARGFYFSDKLDKANAIVNRDAPADIDWLSYRFEDNGMPVVQQVVDREAYVKQHTAFLPDSERREVVATLPAPNAKETAAQQTLYEKPIERFRFSLAPTYRQIINGGASGFFFYELGLGLRSELRLTENTRISSFLKYRAFDNYDTYLEATATTQGTLPRVRTLLRDYYTNSRFNIVNLQASHFEKLGDNHYVSVYGGLLESFFGGVGSEYLYRPFQSPLAIGVDVNRVRQRSFEQRFDFRDYEVTTGHVTAYWETGFKDILAKVSVGQYLAGDRGATFDLSRVFRNGVVMGGYFTRTNVSAADFGEGSFDKGIYIGIPFDTILPKSSAGYIETGFQPLTRDGGAKLLRDGSLYSVTEKAGSRALSFQPVRP